MYESKIKSEAMDKLFAAVARLENEEECYRFFEDLCTINELQAMAQRYEVARMLKRVIHILPLPKNRRIQRDHIAREPLPAIRREGI